MQQNRDEHEKSKRGANVESARYCNTIHESMQQESRKRRHAHRPAHFVHFLTEVEMRNESMLREMNEKKSDQDERSRACAVLLNCFRRKIENRDGQHEARRQRDELFQSRHTPSRARCNCGSRLLVYSGGM